MTLLLFQDLSLPNLVQYGQAGLMGLMFIAFLFFLLRALPVWKQIKDGDKEVKIAEIAVREKEAEARAAQATSFGQLSGALSSISDVLNNVAIKQKEATDKVLILSRVNAESNERNDSKFDQVIEHIEDLSKRVTNLETTIKSGRKAHGPQGQ
jgi:hypothetical protein